MYGRSPGIISSGKFQFSSLTLAFAGVYSYVETNFNLEEQNTMTKFYINDGEHKLVIDKDSKADALKSYANHWLGAGAELNPKLYIDNRGFAGPEAADETIDTKNVLRTL
jgi:hypothetical protein